MSATDTSTLPVAPVALKAGDQMASSTEGPITRTDIVKYAGAGGDFNPIHHDEPFATSAGLPQVFAMGMMHAGMLGYKLARWVGPANVRSYGVRFTGQVWPDDVLTFTGTVDAVADGVATISLQVTRQTGDVVLKASAAAAVAEA